MGIRIHSLAVACVLIAPAVCQCGKLDVGDTCQTKNGASCSPHDGCFYFDEQPARLSDEAAASTWNGCYLDCTEAGCPAGETCRTLVLGCKSVTCDPVITTAMVCLPLGDQ